MIIGQHSDPLTNLQMGQANIAPRTGAVKYIQIYCRCPLTKAGPKERAGFIEAPVIGPANNASNAIVAPTTTPAMRSFSFVLVEIFKITNINKKESRISRTKA